MPLQALGREAPCGCPQSDAPCVSQSRSALVDLSRFDSPPDHTSSSVLITLLRLTRPIPVLCVHLFFDFDVGSRPQEAYYYLVTCRRRIAVPSNVVHDVVDKVKGQHYQVACLKVFEATHPGGTSESLQHPNTYFQDSMRYYEDKEKKNEEKAAGGGAADRKPTVEGQAVKMDTA